jgi:hypothetical protein
MSSQSKSRMLKIGMLRLLLDEHISPVVACELRAKHPKLFVLGLVEWANGIHLGSSDEELLQKAFGQGLTLVTYDLRTIPPLLKAWIEAGVSHGGVIFVDERTIAPNDFGGLVKALAAVWQASGSQDWTDQVLFLRRSE